MRCDKCLSPDHEGQKFRKYAREERSFGEFGELKALDYWLCGFCSNVFLEQPNIEEFLKDDYGELGISEISKSMIEARKRRAVGESYWKGK